MNQRFDEIEKQSYTEVQHERGGTYMAFDKQKFAELIVRECAEVADKEYNVPGCGYITKTKGMRIREHFGVDL